MSTSNTEEKIKQAAIEVFSKKGYADTKTRDIASKANANISALHYYYGSKDKLFKTVTDDMFKQFNILSELAFDSNLSFKEKIEQFVSRWTDFCKENPHVPAFIIFESERHPDKVYGGINFKAVDNIMEKELEELISKKIIRPISYVNFMLNLVSLTLFPFLNKHMLHEINGLSDGDYKDLLETRKKMIPEMIIDYLYVKK
ncbi:MAG: TetR/AcrR family transcriptional regulator [Maribacter sp.]|nr:TetR/AcrR family transcriptional regulator [Maribacter sp.]